MNKALCAKAMAASSNVTEPRGHGHDVGRRGRGIADGCYDEVISATQRNSVVRVGAADQEVILFPPPNPQQDLHNAEQLSRQRYTDLAKTSARRAQLGIQKPRLRESIRHWYRRLTRREPTEG